MCSRCRRKHAGPRWAAIGGIAVAVVASGCARGHAEVAGGVLRVCADPNNLPFSNDRREGFENRLAELVARDLHATVRYTWWAQRRGYVRNTLAAGKCDVLPGVVGGLHRVLSTRPYYRSTYVFVARRHGPSARSFDDPVLRTARVGVQMIGDDFANTPPAHALARRHIVENVRGYSVTANYQNPNPPSRIIDAVARGDIDVAVVWGPTAGYFARRSSTPLALVPVSPRADGPSLPFVFDIGMAVRPGDVALRDRLDSVLLRRRGEIDAILAEYGVPRVDSVALAGARR